MNWDNPFNKKNIGDTVMGLIGPASGILGNSISGGYQSGVGNTMQGLGTVASAIPGPYGTIASAGLNVLGGVSNALFGERVNQERLNTVNNSINYLSGFNSNANSFDDLQDIASVGNFKNPYSGGLFNKSAKRKNRALRTQFNNALDFANRSIGNNIDNLIQSQEDEFLSNYFADGGSIKPENRGKFTALPKQYKDGGPLTNGGIFSNGVIFIESGGTHEDNPMEGVMLGMDSSGVPNLVEEGEVIWNDYVFSDRLQVPDDVKEKYKLRGAKDMTYAQAAKKIQKESSERPNDPISKNGLDTMLAKLAIEQEKDRIAKEPNIYANGGNLFAVGGPYEYGTSILNYDKNKDTSSIYKKGSNYMNNRQYALDNWDTPYVQNWLNKSYIPFVNSYNKSRGYNGSFTVNKDQFAKGTLDSQWGGMHQGLMGFMTPDEEALATSIKDNSSPVPDFVDTDLLKKNMATPIDLSINSSRKAPKSKNNNVEPTWLRYAPVVGSALSVVNDFMPWSRPDYSNVNAILEASKDAGNFREVSPEFIGNYLRYQPFDRDFYLNKLNASAGATRRGIINQSGNNRATAMAGLIASDYNTLGKIGDLARQAEEYNLAQRERVEAFNRGTNQFNAEARMKADIANQEATLRARASRLSGAAQAAAMRQGIDDRIAASRSANFTNLFNNLGEIGREAYARNMIRTNPALYYDIGKDGEVSYKTNSRKKSRGGYLTIRNHRKKGGKNA